MGSGDLEERWLHGDALRVGVEVAGAMSPSERAGWATNVLSVAVDALGVECARRALRAALAVAAVPDRWGEGHDVFDALRRETLRLERSGDSRTCQALLMLAEVTAKTLYNASGGPAPFDRDSFAWVSKNALTLAEAVGDEGLTSRLLGAVMDSAPIADASAPLRPMDDAAGGLVPLLTHLEAPRADSNLDDATAIRLVRFALTGSSDYWADQALDWVSAGGVDAEVVAEPLAHCSQREGWPQSVRHRARSFWKGTRRYTAAMLLRRMALSAPPSDMDAQAVEGSLLPLQDIPGVEDFVSVLAAYSPLNTRERGIAGPDELASAARDALHDLGDHSLCPHGTEPP
jgi:hypothetical protein